MKLVVAMIQPQQLPAVKEALFEAQIRHMTCTNVLGTAESGAELLTFRGIPHQVTLFPKVRVEIALSDSFVEAAIDAITRGAQVSGGTGFIFVCPLLQAINVRTGERGRRAL